MAFDVQWAPGVVEYLNSREHLTQRDRDAIIDNAAQELRDHADEFFQRNQHPTETNLYWDDFVLMTEALEVRTFLFWCDASHHVYGITEVQYVEEGEERG